MLAIRAEQMEAFRRQAPHHFEAEMAAHLAEVSPRLVHASGEAQTRHFIRLGIERAGSHGFDRRGPVRIYLEAMLLLGSHFDTDPQYPWARQILQGRDQVQQMERAQRLFETLQAFLERAAGPGAIFRRRAHEELANLLRTPWGSDAQDLPIHQLRALQDAWPEKAEVIGAEALRALIRTGIAKAHTLMLGTARGWGLFVTLAYGLGHVWAQDPLYPWHGTDLATDETNAARMAERLQDEAILWLEHALP